MNQWQPTEEAGSLQTRSSEGLTPPDVDFPRWYQDVLTKAELSDNGPVRGTMVIRPYGYAIWERIQGDLDARIKAAGAANAYFPLFIPKSYLDREAEHVEGFSPELVIVTRAGGKDLEQPFVVRPTSETIIGEFMAKWTQSYRDLPMLLNQWCNVVRWEMRPRSFLRTTEFLWQEGHTAHVSAEDAVAYTRRIHLDVYREFLVNVMAIPVLVGLKTAAERFAGAVNTLTCEAMMADGKALQMATTHELGQNFARAFDIRYLNQDGVQRLAWTTSWGSSARLVGGLIMSHGDAGGLRLPPRLAPVQVVVLPVRDDEKLLGRCADLSQAIAGVGARCTVDRGAGSFGRRVTGWEIKGVPVRVEVGPRDLAAGQVTVARRDTGEKTTVGLDAVVPAVTAMLNEIQGAMLADAERRRDERTKRVETIEEAIGAANEGFAVIPWRLIGDEGEARLAQEALTIRCLQRPDGTLPESEVEPDLVAVVSRSY
jgi:prolyl-tRNA synthetase